MSWAQAIAIDHMGEGRYRGHVDEAWTSLQGVHGGVVAAIALTATERALVDVGVDPTTTLRAATLGYVAGNMVGDLTVDVDTVRRGRSLVTAHARTSQQGKTTTVARFHHSPPWEGMAYSDAPPMPQRPEQTIHPHRPGVPATSTTWRPTSTLRPTSSREPPAQSGSLGLVHCTGRRSTPLGS